MNQNVLALIPATLVAVGLLVIDAAAFRRRQIGISSSERLSFKQRSVQSMVAHETRLRWVFTMPRKKPVLMYAGVACGTEGNQVVLAIVAGLAAKFLVMNLKI